MDVCIHGQMIEGQMNGQMDKWIPGQTDGCTDRWIRDGYFTPGKSPGEGLVSTEPLTKADKSGNHVLLLQLFIKNTKWHNCKK